MRSKEILIVDDEVGIREVLQEILEDEGHTVVLAENAEQARNYRNQTRPALVLLDIWMPDSDGITLLKEWAKNGQLNMPVVMMSGHGSIDTAVEATKIGALDFLEKPIPLPKLLATVEHAFRMSENQPNFTHTDLDKFKLKLEKLGKSDVIVELNKQLERAIQQDAPVLLVGEMGSPFEYIAQYFHQNPETPWVALSYAESANAIENAPLELLQKATGGVLYLGDIAQYNRFAQQGIAFLLSKAERYRVRVIGAYTQSLVDLNLVGLANENGQDNSNPNSNSNLDGRDCNKLLNILSSLVIKIPPLREQLDDIPFLVNEILRDLNANLHFSDDAFERLKTYNWTGNFEQLKNVVRNVLLQHVNPSDVIEASDIQRVLNQFICDQNEVDLVNGFDFSLSLRELREQLERRYFEYHIQKEGNNMSRVAQKVGLERTHLYRKLKQLGIDFMKRGQSQSNQSDELED